MRGPCVKKKAIFLTLQSRAGWGRWDDREGRLGRRGRSGSSVTSYKDAFQNTDLEQVISAKIHPSSDSPVTCCRTQNSSLVPAHFFQPHSQPDEPVNLMRPTMLLLTLLVSKQKLTLCWPPGLVCSLPEAWRAIYLLSHLVIALLGAPSPSFGKVSHCLPPPPPSAPLPHSHRLLNSYYVCLLSDPLSTL